MSEVLQIPSFSDANILEQTELTADIAVGATTGNLLNPQNYSVNDYVVFDPGEETAEIKTISAITADAVTFSSATTVRHNKFSKVVKLFGNKVRVYRATNVNGYVPDNDDFSVLATTDIDPDQDLTRYTDSTGGSGYWYKFTYYNSTSGAETNTAISPAVRGGGVGHYVSIEDVRNECGIPLNNINNTQIAARRAQAEAIVKGTCVSAGYTMPLQDAAGNEYTPETIELATLLIAAGYVLQRDYGDAAGEVGEQIAKDGKGKVKQGKDLLKDISEGTITLLDSTGQQLARTVRVSGWPDETTETSGTDGTPQPFMVPINKVF